MRHDSGRDGSLASALGQANHLYGQRSRRSDDHWTSGVLGGVVNPYLDPEITARGFQRMASIPSQYGGFIETYESSSASSPQIWVNTKCPVDLNRPDGDMKNAIVLLKLADALRFAQQLLYLVSNHYQVSEQS